MGDNYINANFINSDLGEKKLFIATQGPLTSSFYHFWKMIWQNDVGLIVMLCNLREGERAQCDQYWPEKIG